ncbi:MAG: transcriptional repressor LexA [Pseudomonadota bacterium]|nr:transcriptional repressor LexA [Pseudomonadota bacterium]
MKLTARQLELLDLIRDQLSHNGMPPTLVELAGAMGVNSTNAVRGHLKALEKKGLLELIPGTSRGIRLLEEDLHEPGLPVVGRVAAGAPILAQQHIERHCRVDPGLFSDRADYLLRVHGMSMRDAGILDGDLVAVKRAIDVYSRQIAVVRVDDEVTVKRIKLNQNMAYLYPDNPDYSVIEVDMAVHEVCIEGVVVGVIRPKIL